MERAKSFAAAILLDPINMLRLLKSKEVLNREPGFAQAVGGFSQFARSIAVVFFGGLNLEKLNKTAKAAAKFRGVGQSSFSHSKGASPLKDATSRDAIEKAVRSRNQLSHCAARGPIFKGLEKTFPGAGVIEPLQVAPQSELRNLHSNMARGYVLERVRLVKDDKIFRKENPVATLLVLRQAPQQREKEGMIQHHEVRREHSAAKGLIKAAGVFCAALLRADVLLASHLFPNLQVRLHQEIAQRAISRRETPFSDSLELGTLPRREKVRGLT